MSGMDNTKVPIVVCVSEDHNGEVKLVNAVDLENMSSSIDFLSSFSLIEMTSKHIELDSGVRTMLSTDEFSSLDMLYGHIGDKLTESISEYITEDIEYAKNSPNYYFFRLQFTGGTDREKWSGELMGNKKYADSLSEVIKSQHLFDRDKPYCFNAEKVVGELTLAGKYDQFLSTKLNDRKSDEYKKNFFMLREVCLKTFSNALDNAQVLKQKD